MLNSLNEFTLNEHVDIERKGVDGGVHRSLNGVLNRNYPEVDLALMHGKEHIGHGLEWDSDHCGKVGLPVEGLLGECSLRTQKANASWLK